jgi:hypothetical protein
VEARLLAYRRWVWRVSLRILLVELHALQIERRLSRPSSAAPLLGGVSCRLLRVLESGGIKSWSLVKLTFPYATSSDYNYATFVNSAKFPDL